MEERKALLFLRNAHYASESVTVAVAAAAVAKKTVKALLSRLSWSKYLCEKSGLIQLETN